MSKHLSTSIAAAVLLLALPTFSQARTSTIAGFKTAGACADEYKANKGALKDAKEKKKDFIAACRALPPGTPTPIGTTAIGCARSRGGTISVLTVGGASTKWIMLGVPVQPSRRSTSLPERRWNGKSGAAQPLLRLRRLHVRDGRDCGGRSAIEERALSLRHRTLADALAQAGFLKDGWHDSANYPDALRRASKKVPRGAAGRAMPRSQWWIATTACIGGEANSFDRDFSSAQDSADLSGLLDDKDDGKLGTLLRDTFDLYAKQITAHIDYDVVSKADPAQRTPPLHGRLTFIDHAANDAERHYCFPRPSAFQRCCFVCTFQGRAYRVGHRSER